MGKKLRVIFLPFLMFFFWSVYHGAFAVSSKNDAAKVEQIQGSDLKQITLSPKAAERLGIETSTLLLHKQTITPQQSTKINSSGIQKPVIPYSALLYDANGGTWVYVLTKPLTFVRYQVIVDHIESNDVFLHDAPPVGTEIVIVGVDELWGIEKGIAK